MFRVQLRWPFVRACAVTIPLMMTSGCSWRDTTYEPSVAVRPPVQANVPSTNLVLNAARAPGRVVSVNAPARFAVVSFPVGQVPANDTRFSVWRAGMKVGELKISGPAQDSFTVGDIIAGAAQEGDDVRAE